ncbi:MAG: DUF1801 domain-containing protein [Flavobacteriales bacterium]
MVELKTKPTEQKVNDFIAAVEHEGKRNDAHALIKLMKEITGAEPQMWGPSIIGFGTYHYKYATGREADWFLCGFSPRKQSISIYIMSGFTRYQELLEQLGKHKTGKGCLYVKKLEDINLEILKKLITASVEHLRNLDSNQR